MAHAGGRSGRAGLLNLGQLFRKALLTRPAPTQGRTARVIQDEKMALLGDFVQCAFRARANGAGRHMARLPRRMAPRFEPAARTGRSHARGEILLATGTWSALDERSLHAHRNRQLLSPKYHR